MIMKPKPKKFVAETEKVRIECQVENIEKPFLLEKRQTLKLESLVQNIHEIK